MSTKITVNVSGNNLLATNKEQQAANRQLRLQKDEDEKFLKDIENIEKVQLQKAAVAQSNGAIPEYSIPIETSAQRGISTTTGGWLDMNRMFAFEEVPGSTEALQYNIGSGNGKKWKTIEVRPEFTIPDSVATGATEELQGVMYVYDAFFPDITGDSNDPPYPLNNPPPPEGAIAISANPFEDIEGNESVNGAVGIFGNEDTFKAWIEGTPLYGYDGPERPGLNLIELDLQKVKRTQSQDSTVNASWIVYPVTDRKAVVTVRYLWNFSKRYNDGFTELGGGVFTNENLGSPTFAAPKYLFFAYWDVGSVGVLVPSNPFLPETSRQVLVTGSLRIDIYYLIVKNLNPENPAIVYEYYFNLQELYDDYPSLQPGPVTYAHEERGPYTNSFLLTHENVKEIPTPQQLLDKYNIRFPNIPWVTNRYDIGQILPWTNDYLYGLNSWTQLPASAYMGAGMLRTELPLSFDGFDTTAGNGLMYLPPTYLWGTPGVYDYADTDFYDPNFYNINEDGPVLQSAYAPSSGTPLFAPNHTIEKSGYEYLSQLKDEVLGDTYFYSNNPIKWLYLTEAQRTEGEPSYSIYEPIDIPAPKDPKFFYSLFSPVNDGVFYLYDGWYSNDPGDIDQTTFYMKESGFESPLKKWRDSKLSLSLSRQRILPPSLGLSDLNRTVHPYIDLYEGTVFNSSGGLLGDRLHSSLSIIAWTAWGKNWTSKLIELGFTTGDLT